MEIPFTNAEKLAEKAENFPAFSGLKLAHVKKQLTALLELIGRDGIFDEYTRHDISHINKMLEMLDWTIPEDTKAIMSPADWLMTVLAIYFHDLGMLVTKNEYEMREASGFPEFRDKILFGGDKGKDYKTKVDKLGSDRGERFAYQEFVRHKHAERIRAWIMGQEREHLGISSEVVTELDRLLAPLNIQFRRDLSLVCESHHLNDLDDFNKYKVSQPYGDSESETANVQYAAVLMRTADLLHITSDRTLSISYRVINPTDPISQDEWAKQMAVTRVRSKYGFNKEGNQDETVPRDTIEVYAYFKKEDGFFGLTSYLAYAEEQLQKSYEWVLKSNKTKGAKHKFPWRYIDDTHIETEGFIKETFEFSFDQAKILDLLTGHTLYNDIKVVIRELIQNSIDAVRLQRLIDNNISSETSAGKVDVYWNSKDRTLSVLDNGTGMTQQIIEENLLKVGASRYQSEDFKNSYPNFSSISRFGIGILSTFMISDSVEILTCHPNDEKARQLSLRSVHGKYLIRLLDKFVDSNAKKLSPHGTEIKLTVRQSVDMSDIVETVKRWIIIPNCEVTVFVDENPPVQIGFSSPKEAIVTYLQEKGIFNENDVKVIEETQDDVTLAYAVEWSKYFNEWSFMRVAGKEKYAYDQDDNAEEPFLGTCIEGIRVEFNSPGFYNYSIIALSNAFGPNAPKTNVARSGLESTLEREKMLGTVYEVLLKHVANEVNDLRLSRSFSLTWAVNESRYLLNPLTYTTKAQIINYNLFYKKVQDLPIVLVDEGKERKAVSITELQKNKSFWTIDSISFRSAEALLREIPGNSSLFSILNVFGNEDFELPEEPIVCSIDPDNRVESYAFLDKEVAVIKVNNKQRRVDLKWSNKATPPRWRSFPASAVNRVRRTDILGVGGDLLNLRIGQGEIELIGISNELAIQTSKKIYILPNSKIAQFLIHWLDKLEMNIHSQDLVNNVTSLFNLISIFLRGRLPVPTDLPLIQRIFPWAGGDTYNKIINPELVEIINSTNWITFNPSVWDRGVKRDEDIEF